MFNEKLEVMSTKEQEIKSIKKTLDFLVDLKREIDYNPQIAIRPIIEKHKVQSAIGTILIKNGIIKRHGGRKYATWEWKTINPNIQMAGKVNRESKSVVTGWARTRALKNKPKQTKAKPIVVTFSDKPIVTEKPKVKRTYTNRKVETPIVKRTYKKRQPKVVDAVKKQRVFSIAWGLITIKY